MSYEDFKQFVLERLQALNEDVQRLKSLEPVEEFDYNDWLDLLDLYLYVKEIEKDHPIGRRGRGRIGPTFKTTEEGLNKEGPRVQP